MILLLMLITTACQAAPQVPDWFPTVAATLQANATGAATASEPPSTATPRPTETEDNVDDPTVEPIEADPTEEPTDEPTAEATVPPTPDPLPVRFTSGSAEMLLAETTLFPMGASSEDLFETCEMFRTGCSEDWFTSSEPVHGVTLDDFYIDETEVTNAAYIAFLNELGDHADTCDGNDCVNLEDSEITQADSAYTISAEFANHPVTGVTWHGADAFCTWRDARLPTEAEWERAAGWDADTETKSMYPWGDEFDADIVNICDGDCDESQADADVSDGYPRTAPVNSFPEGASPIGAVDMAGNVWEWVSDWYDEEAYDSEDTENPTGPISGDLKTVRGGSWFDTGNFVAVAVRFPVPPDESGDTIGFRCVADVETVRGEMIAAVDVETPTPLATATEEATATATTMASPTTTPTVVATAEPTASPTSTVAPTSTIAPTATPAATATSAATATAVASPTLAPTRSSNRPTPEECAKQPGTDLGDTYIVGLCETLSSIAAKLGINYAELVAVNPQIEDPNFLVPGQVINLPPRESSATATVMPSPTATPPSEPTVTPGPGLND